MMNLWGHKRRRWVTALALTVLLAFVLAGCGGSGGPPTDSAEGKSYSQSVEMPAAEPEAAYDQDGFNHYYDQPKEDAIEEESAPATGASDGNATELVQEKLIYTAHISVETLDFERSRDLLLNLIARQNGIIQSQTFNDDTSLTRYNDNDYKRRSMNVVARVPSANYDAFVGAMGDIGYIRNSNSSVDNISQRYYDTQTRLSSLRIQEERLLEMMRQSTTVEEMIQVESALSNVQYEIDRNTTDLRYMDRDVAYSTVTVYLSEVHEYSNVPTHRLNFWERLVKSLSGSWNFLLTALEGLLVAVIYILPFAVIAFVIVLLIRKTMRKRRQNKE
ncbi:MAG: DUF4349 domain-containing protein [Syntrophomonadaceae bacterium]|nr:DUF4349 domain-containing protein [Syntrophomonadaceae bacterium]